MYLYTSFFDPLLERGLRTDHENMRNELRELRKEVRNMTCEKFRGPFWTHRIHGAGIFTYMNGLNLW